MKKVEISKKSRRLVERAINLNVRRSTTSIYAACLPEDSERTMERKHREADQQDKTLTRRALLAKQLLLEHIAELEKKR